MKRGLIVVILLAVFCSGVFAQGRYDNEEFISRPARENWLVYIDYSLKIVEDLELKEQSVEDVTGTIPVPSPFAATNDTDIELKENVLLLGVSKILVDKEEEGKYSLYGSIGTTSSLVGLYSTGNIGLEGYITKWGLEGDLMKFGRFLDKGISFDVSLFGYMSTGSGKSGIVKQDFEMIGGGLDVRGFFNAKANLADTTEALVYIGGQALYTVNQLSIENKTATWSGTGVYDLEQEIPQNMFYLILGSKFYWEKDRTTIDIWLSTSFDRSYVIGVKLSQTF